jgi:hypothetical protein
LDFAIVLMIAASAILRIVSVITLKRFRDVPVFVAGMTLAEAATALVISTATAERRWRYARAWLARRRAQVPLLATVPRHLGKGVMIFVRFRAVLRS